MTTKEGEQGRRSSYELILFVLAMLIGFLLGFLAHDDLVQHSQIARDIKSWYPR